MFALIDYINAWDYRQKEKKRKYQSYELVNSEESINNRYDLASSSPMQWNGMHHSFFLVLIITIIILKGLHVPVKWPEYIQEILLFLVSLICIIFDAIWTKQTIKNWFKKNYSTRIEPVAEVIVIFVGLLFTMSAPIHVLTNLDLQFGPRVRKSRGKV